MKTHHFRSVLWLMGCLGCAVFIARAADADSPTQAALEAYPYRPDLVAVPTPAVTVVNAATPTIDPSFITNQPKDRSFRDLEAAMAHTRARDTASLWVWELRWNTELRLVERPSFHEIDIPWSPMTTPTEIAFSPYSVGSVSNKLQVRVPLVDMSW